MSVSESPDLARLGLLTRDVDRALTAITAALIYEGATIAYGGDLREGGLTRSVLTDAIRAYRTHELRRHAPVAYHYVSPSTWCSWTREELSRHVKSFNHMAHVHLISSDGGCHILTGGDDAIRVLRSGAPNYEEVRNDELSRLDDLWETIDPACKTPGLALTLMREAMARDCDARILLGGRVSGYAGDGPGIAEEAFTALVFAKPVIALGGFGGCARDMAFALGYLDGDGRLSPISPASSYAPAIDAVAQAARTDTGRRALAKVPVDLARSAAVEDTPDTLAVLCTRMLAAALAPGEGSQP